MKIPKYIYQNVVSLLCICFFNEAADALHAVTQEGRSRAGASGNCCPTFLAVKSLFPSWNSGLFYNRHISDGRVF